MDFSKKVVLITGASSGIGASCALKFAELNACLILVGRNTEKLNNVGIKCKELNGNQALIITADLSIDEDVQRIISETVDTYGKLDVLVNNAACFFLDGEMEHFDKMMATNLRGTFLLTKKAIDLLVKTKGNIVNVSSILSMIPLPYMTTYCMTKAAINMFTKCLALELGPKGVRANTVNPGLVDTNLLKSSLTDEEISKLIDVTAGKVPLRRITGAEDVAKLISFLASDDAHCITGTTHVIDCGTLLGEAIS